MWMGVIVSPFCARLPNIKDIVSCRDGSKRMCHARQAHMCDTSCEQWQAGWASGDWPAHWLAVERQ